MEIINEKSSDNYIKTGYEEDLEDILLNKEIAVVFINGEFGAGKTTILKHVVDKIKSEDKKFNIKYLNVYEEYIEINYIDYLYKSIKGDESVIWSWIKENLIFVILSLISFLFFFYSLIIKELITSVTLESEISNIVLFIVILGITYVTFDLVKRKLEKTKINKLKYIKKQLENYNYIIIDDLDRVYINSNEILKMIHFLQEHMKGNKLILLGDKSKFKENKIDILEKYYDYSFEMPKEIIVQNMVRNLGEYIAKEYSISYSDDIEDVKKIMNQCMPRQLIKIYKHLEVVKKNKSLFEIIDKLYRSDYLFMLVIYYRNNIPLKEIIKMIQSFNLNHRFVYSENNYKEFDDKNITIINQEDRLSKEEKDYLIKAYKQNVGKGAELIDNFVNTSYGEPELSSEWRIIKVPRSYNMNTFMSSKESLNKLINNFEYNLDNDYEKTEYPIIELYKEKVGDDKFKEVLLERIQKVDDYNSKNLFDYLYRNGSLDKHSDINLQYYNIIFESKRYDEKETFTNLNNIIDDATWEKLQYVNKLDFLCREASVPSETQIRRDKLIKDENEVIKILEKMIEHPKQFQNFSSVFGDKIKDSPNIEKYIDKIIDKLLEIADKEILEEIEQIKKVYKKQELEAKEIV